MKRALFVDDEPEEHTSGWAGESSQPQDTAKGDDPQVNAEADRTAAKETAAAALICEQPGGAEEEAGQGGAEEAPIYTSSRHLD